MAAGNNVTYTITYANLGPDVATNVVLTETYDSRVSFVSANPAPDIGTNNRWSIGTLSPGIEFQVFVTVQVAANTSPGAVLLNHVVLSNPVTSASANETTTVQGQVATSTPTRTRTNTPIVSATPTRTPISTATFTPTRTVMPTWTFTSTRTPIGGPTATPTSPNAGGQDFTATPGRTPTPSPATRGNMGVRFVSVGRVNRGSEMYYSIAVVLYGRGTVPDVQAQVTLPSEVLFLWAEPAPASAPAIGSSGGVVAWDLGDLTGPTNAPLQIAVQVRTDLKLGITFTGYMHLTNGLGDVVDLPRLSRVGRYDRPNGKVGDNGQLHVTLTTPRQVKAGAAIRYTVTARSKVAGTTITARTLLAPGVLVDKTDPPALSVDAPGDVPGLVLWSIPNTRKTQKLRLYTHTSIDLPSGLFLDNFTQVDNGLATPVVVEGTTMIR